MMKSGMKIIAMLIVGLLASYPVVSFGQGAVRITPSTAIDNGFITKPFGYGERTITYSSFADYLKRSGMNFNMEVEGSGAAFENINYKISVLGTQVPVKMVIVKNNRMTVITDGFRLDARKYKQYLVGQGWKSTLDSGGSVLEGTFDSFKISGYKIYIVNGGSAGFYSLEISIEYEKNEN